jgi:hypothetical protein
MVGGCPGTLASSTTKKTSLPSLTLNYIKDCQSILEEVVSADRTKNNNKMAKLSN